MLTSIHASPSSRNSTAGPESSSPPKATQLLPSLQYPHAMAPVPDPLCPPYSLPSVLFLKVLFAVLARPTDIASPPVLTCCLLLCTKVFGLETALCFVSSMPGDPRQIKQLSKYVLLPTAFSSVTL